MTNQRLVEDFEVIWNGAHHGQDQDLLSDGLARVPDKRLGALPPRKDATALVADVLEDHRGRPLTMLQIAKIAAITPQTATTGLYHLRMQGRLGSQDLPGRQAPWGGRAVKEYWLLR